MLSLTLANSVMEKILFVPNTSRSPFKIPAQMQKLFQSYVLLANKVELTQFMWANRRRLFSNVNVFTSIVTMLLKPDCALGAF